MQHTIPPRGWCVETACRLEASAPKPGNVHPSAEFPDLTHAELVAAGIAIAPVIDAAATRPLGRTILEAVEASRSVTRSNANLGIILAIAPLAAVPDGRPLAAGVVDVLDATTSADAADVWRAIALADPGNLGRSRRHDLAGPPPDSLLAAMREAAAWDGIARLWATAFRELFEEVVPRLADEIARGRHVDDAIVQTHLAILARHPDTLIARKHGDEIATMVSRMAGEVLACEEAVRPQAIAEFDAFLRTPPRKNPGTSADFVAASLYILLREGVLS